MPRRSDQEAGVADKYPFLSDAWFDAAEKLINEHEHRRRRRRRTSS